MDLKNYNKDELEAIKRYLEDELKENELNLQDLKEVIIAMLLDDKNANKEYVRDEYRGLIFYKRALCNQIGDIECVLNPEREG